MVLFEQLNLATGDGHHDDANFYVWRKIRDHCSAKIIDGGKAVARPAQWRNGRIPIALLSVHLRKINRGQHLKTTVDIRRVLFLKPGKAFHIRLPKTQEDQKVYVLRKSVHVQQK